MRQFKDYTLAELKLIAKSFNKHVSIDFTKMKKAEIVKALEEKLEHNEKGEIQLKKKLMSSALPLMKSDVLKYVETNPDSSIKYAIIRLLKHYKLKYNAKEAEMKMSRDLETIYAKHKGKKDVAKINELVIAGIDAIISGEKKTVKKNKLVTVQ